MQGSNAKATGEPIFSRDHGESDIASAFLSRGWSKINSAVVFEYTFMDRCKIYQNKGRRFTCSVVRSLTPPPHRSSFEL
jgi:hypothetical protein